MAVSARHFFQQGAAFGALARTAVGGLLSSFALRPTADPVVPGPEFRAETAPLPESLLRDYIAHVGGDPAAYAGAVPHHLFPQWTFALAARTLEGSGYPLLRVVNGGCRLVCQAPLPAGVPLVSAARLEHIDDNGRRVVLRQRITSGPAGNPEALVADLYAIVPLPGAQGTGERRQSGESKPVVPVDAREIEAWTLAADAGLDFAKLTGDLNPIHWLPAYARMSGFRSVILHGFATMARAFEGVVRGVCRGRVGDLREIDVRFTRPLVLPARVGLFVREHEVFVGDALGGPAYLAGSFVAAAAGD